jgi:hypothetical protein
MSNNQKKYLFIALSALFYACGQNNRERSKIPPTPFLMQLEATQVWPKTIINVR